jgi:uncharacterized protein Yka (UPF0111/DUF47 family)
MTDALAAALEVQETSIDVEAFVIMEHSANQLRLRNIDRLNHAFSTPFDREDIYRAADSLDGIVLHSMRTVRELCALELVPDQAMLELATIIRSGVAALDHGFETLSKDGAPPTEHIELARDTDRKARRRYEVALATLFEGDDIRDMMKRREIYHHLTDGASHVRQVARILGDIVVKTV